MTAQKTIQKKSVASPVEYSLVKATDLGNDFPRREVTNESFSLWTRQLLFNRRQGTVGCKGRSEVAYANRKPWKQKGTGRARAGSARSPLWRGGGIIFGPQMRVRKLDTPQKVKQGVLNALLWNYIDRERFFVADWNIVNDLPKTSHAFELLKQLGIQHDKVALLISIEDSLTLASFVNIPNVRIVLFDAANAIDLAWSDYWIVLKKDMNIFTDVVARWI